MKVLIYDIETYKEIFLLKIYNPENDQWFDFYISRYENNFDSFFKFIDEYKEYYFVGYNGLRFDSQVLEWIIRNYNNWHDLSNLEICGKICQKAQDIIDDANYELFPEYREDQLSLKQIDLFTIWHFNNENRRTSLKAIEYALDMELIEELPIHFLKENLTREEIEEIKSYCKNDILATYQFYLVTRGQTNLKLYKGEDKIADRLAMQEEFGLNCLNWDDVKIGAEWNKLDYIKATGRNERDLKPKEIKHFYGKKFKQFFPKWVKFQTPELQKFVRELGETYIINKKQEFKFNFSNIKI